MESDVNKMVEEETYNSFPHRDNELTIYGIKSLRRTLETIQEAAMPLANSKPK